MSKIIPSSNSINSYRIRRQWLVIVFLFATPIAILLSNRFLWLFFQRESNKNQNSNNLFFSKMSLWIWPRSPDSWVLHAKASRKSYHLDEAESAIKRARELAGHPTESIQIETLLLRVARGETEEPSILLGKYLDQGHADSSEILRTLSAAFIRDLRYGPAFNCTERWASIDSKNPEPFFWRGWIHERMSNLDAAGADYRKSIQVDPNFEPARLRLTEIYLEDKSPLDAKEHILFLFSKSPKKPQIQSLYAQLLYWEGNSIESRKYFEKAMEYLPNDGPIIRGIATIDMENGNPEAAIVSLKKLLCRDPGDIEAIFKLSAAFRISGNIAESKKALNEYEKLDKMLAEANSLLQNEARTPSTDADSVARIGKMLLELSQEPQALYWLDKALERDPRCQLAHITLADHFTKKGDGARAAFHQKQVNAGFKKP